MAEPPPPPAGLPGQAPALDPQAGQIPPPSGGPIPAAALQPAPPLPVGPIPAAAAAGLPPAAMLMAVPAPTPQEAGAAAAAAATAAFRQHMASANSLPDASRGSGENTFVAGHVRIQRPRSAHGTNHLARICGSLPARSVRRRIPRKSARVTSDAPWPRRRRRREPPSSWNRRPRRKRAYTPHGQLRGRVVFSRAPPTHATRPLLHSRYDRGPGTTARSASLLIVDVLCERATRASASGHHQQDSARARRAGTTSSASSRRFGEPAGGRRRSRARRTSGTWSY